MKINLFNPFKKVEQKALVGNYKSTEAQVGKVDTTAQTDQSLQFLKQQMGQDIFKAYIPWFLYKPPFGYTRTVNPLQLRLFAENPYIFSVIKAIQDEVACTPYDIVLKEEYAKDDGEYDDEARKEILKFFDRPNDNPFETFERILKSWVKDINEIGNCIGVKIFDRQGRFKQLIARDASTFLLNTNIHGMLSDRVDFVPTPTVDYLTQGLPTDRTSYSELSASDASEKISDDMRSGSFVQRYSEAAAYFQYGWTAGARPVPFGKREIMWIDMNPRTNNIYPQSPIEVLWNTVLTLVYGGEYNLDFYLNNNLPNGMLWFEGATNDQADSYRTQLSNQIMEHDEFNNVKKKHFKVPVTAHQPKFIPMQMTSKDMEVIAQQEWFMKLLYACYGVNSNEMGYTGDVNKSDGETQERSILRKMVKPFLSAIEKAINMQLMPEFESQEFEFKFTGYNIDEDIKKHTLLEQELRMGIKNPKMIARELGIDYDEVLEDQVSEFDDGSTGNEGVNNSFDNEIANGMQEEMQKGLSSSDARKKATENIQKNPKYYSKGKKEDKPEKKSIDIDKQIRDTANRYNFTYKLVSQGFEYEKLEDMYEDPLVLLRKVTVNLSSNPNHYNVTQELNTQEQSRDLSS